MSRPFCCTDLAVVARPCHGRQQNCNHRYHWVVQWLHGNVIVVHLSQRPYSCVTKCLNTARSQRRMYTKTTYKGGTKQRMPSIRTAASGTPSPSFDSYSTVKSAPCKLQSAMEEPGRTSPLSFIYSAPTARTGKQVSWSTDQKFLDVMSRGSDFAWWRRQRTVSARTPYSASYLFIRTSTLTREINAPNHKAIANSPDKETRRARAQKHRVLYMSTISCPLFHTIYCIYLLYNVCTFNYVSCLSAIWIGAGDASI